MGQPFAIAVAVTVAVSSIATVLMGDLDPRVGLSLLHWGKPRTPQLCRRPAELRVPERLERQDVKVLHELQVEASLDHFEPRALRDVHEEVRVRADEHDSLAAPEVVLDDNVGELHLAKLLVVKKFGMAGLLKEECKFTASGHQ